MDLIARPADPAHPTFFGEVSGVDLMSPLDPGLKDAFVAAMNQFGVCVLRNQLLSDEAHVAFSRLFGELEFVPHFGVPDGKPVRMKLPELFDVSNLDEDGNILKETDRRRYFRAANEMWHTDSSFQPKGASYSLLSAKVIPLSGADTEFADMRAAYAALSDDMKARVESLVVEHATAYSRSLIGYKFDEQELKRRSPTWQYLVQRDSSGRKSLYLASHASHIVGMDMTEGRALLNELTTFATQPRFVHRHVWQVGDLVVWDNRCSMHRATPFDDSVEKRDLRRTTIRGDLPMVSPDFESLSVEALLQQRDQRVATTA
jgi:alpha-ketoglutarate-dependent 2,4-dichlorophenoxyacetate dioxygenase